MRKRQRHKRIYSTNHLFVYTTSGTSFCIEGVINGKRIRRRAKSIEEARSQCHNLEERQRDSNIVRTHLSTQQIRAAERAFGQLGRDQCIVEAVSFHKDKNKLRRTLISDAVWQYLETKEHCSKNTYNQAKGLLMKLVDWANGRTLECISREDAQEYLKTAKNGSHNHYLRFAKSLYKWAITEGIIDDSPFKNIAPKTRIHREVAVLSCEEAKALLEASKVLCAGELLAYTAITLFAGLRPDSEMRHLSWEAINLEDAEIRVTMGKTRIPRTVDMPKNLVKWLMKCDPSHPIYPKNFRRKWAKVRNKAGFKGGAAKTPQEKALEAKLKPWVKDYTRHTAISYRVRQTGDIHRTATWAGNSPAIIRSHYLGLTSGSAARKYWDISVGKTRPTVMD
jgi:hypothetical protein